LRVFQTFTDDLCRLRDWLLDHNCPIIAMESTGIYWRPVHNILEGFFEVIPIDRLIEIPGINFISAYAIISETGPTLSTFPNTASLCSWAGVCPGNNESAGKRHSGRSPVRRGNLKTILIEVACGAVRTKRSYFRAKFFSLRSRLGPKKAIMAIAHRILKAIYHVIKHGEKFKDLGEDYLNDLHKKSKIDYLIRQAGKFGFKLMPCAILEK